MMRAQNGDFVKFVSSSLWAAVIVFVFLALLFQAYYAFAPMPRGISMGFMFSSIWILVFIHREDAIANNSILIWGRSQLFRISDLLHDCAHSIWDFRPPQGTRNFLPVLKLSLAMLTILSRIIFAR